MVPHFTSCIPRRWRIQSILPDPRLRYYITSMINFTENKKFHSADSYSLHPSPFVNCWSPPHTRVMGCGAAESTGLGFVCFVVVWPTELILGGFCLFCVAFSNFSPLFVVSDYSVRD